MVLSLDKVAKSRRGYGTRDIRLMAAHDTSFGVVAIRPAYISRGITLDHLDSEAVKYRRELPTKEAVIGDFEIYVSPLRLIEGTWDDHLIKQHAEAERRQQAQDRARRDRTIRADKIARITTLAPEGVEVKGLSESSDYAQLHLDHLLAILEAAS